MNKDMETSDKSCDICHRMNSVELATSRCIDCCDDLCENCAKAHPANRLSMEHCVLSLNDVEKADTGSQMVGFCEKHTDRKLEVYCFDHEQACCLMCATTEHRKCDEVENVEECAKQSGDVEVEKLKGLLENLKQECADDTAVIFKNEENFGVQVGDVHAHIRSIKESVMRFLNEKETEFIEQLTDMQNEKNTGFSVKVEMLNDFQANIDLDVEKLKNYDGRNEVSLFLEMKQIEKNYKSLRENLQTVRAGYKRVDMKLEDANFLTHILLEQNPFGKLMVEETVEKSKPDLLNSELVLTNVLAKSGCRMTDVEAIGDDQVLAVCDNHNRLHLFSTSGNLAAVGKLSGKPWAMTKTDQETSVAVTIRSPQSSIEIVNVKVDKSPTVSTTKIINLSFKPNGIVCDNGTLIISSTDGLLRHIDTSGNILHTVSVTKGYVYGLCLQSRRIIYSHHTDNGKVYAMYNDKLGSQEFTFEHDKLSYPLGVSYDLHGNMYIVGCSTNNVLQLNSDGVFVREILCKDRDEAVTNPMGIRVAVMGSVPRLLLTCQNEIRVYNFDSY